jgi:hypothetical protein
MKAEAVRRSSQDKIAQVGERRDSKGTRTRDRRDSRWD